MTHRQALMADILFRVRHNIPCTKPMFEASRIAWPDIPEKEKQEARRLVKWLLSAPDESEGEVQPKEGGGK